MASTFHGVNPATGDALEPTFTESTPADVDRAVRAAHQAFETYGVLPGAERARFLRAIADEIDALGEELIERAHAETALPLPRLKSERGRTTGQLRLFADLLDEGSWVEARIDTADVDRKPIPKPDVRRMLVPLGPVAVFAASNFPFAFAVPGGDTASALAAGCPVVCKAHPAHPGTSELAARAISAAALKAGLPAGVFAMVRGWSHAVGLALVRHPLIQAVGFTGSLRGGRAIIDAAAARPDPIPVYAEMGSINPVFLLPSALAQQTEALADGLAAAITLGVGQFCTNPGTIVGLRGPALDRLKSLLAERLTKVEPGVMLYDQLRASYVASVDRARTHGAARVAAAPPASGRASATLLETDAVRFLAQHGLHDEMFGPVSLVVAAGDSAELERIAESLEGQLTATIHGTPEELFTHQRLVQLLQRKVGRLVFNGFPTGVEVCHAMHHGGPYPASSDARTTSVGTAAITRFARPVCYQNFPQAALPAALQDANPAGILRLVNGRQTREPLA